MDFLGIGPLELLFIFLIVLIVLGPQDMVKAGATLGRYLRKIMMSPTWKTVQETSRRIRYLPNTLARQAGLEEFERELKDTLKMDAKHIPGEEGPEVAGDATLGAWTQPGRSNTIGQPRTTSQQADSSNEAPVDDQGVG